MKTLSIGKFAELTEVPIQTIRYYERYGLLPKPVRKLSGHRQYASEDLQRVRFIKRAQQLGFSLKEISELLFLRGAPRTTCQDIKEQAQSKLLDIKKRITDLQKVEKALTSLIFTCRGGKVPKSECLILDFLDSGKTNAF